MQGHTKGVLSAAFSSAGRRIVTASLDNSARLWDAATGKHVATFEGGSTDNVLSAAFSPDGRRIVTATYDTTARIWDATTGEHIATLAGPAGAVSGAAFSPDWSADRSRVDDRTARLWDAGTGEQGHTGSVRNAAFSPDGRRVVTASEDGTTRIWDASRSETIIRSPSVALTAALAGGVGRRTEAESTDLLMQDAPEDMYAEARRQLLDPQKYPPEEIARRERLLEETIAELRAPLHPNCYLSPSQFAEKFGLAAPLATTGETGSDPSPPVAQTGSDASPAAGDMKREAEREGSDPGAATGAGGEAGAASRSDGATLAGLLVLLSAAAAVVGGPVVAAVAGRALFGAFPW